MSFGKKLIIFAAGAAVGSVLTAVYFLKKYRTEIEFPEDLEVYEFFQDQEEPEPENIEPQEEEPLIDYSDILKSNDYTQTTQYNNPKKVDKSPKPFYISDKEYAANEWEYEQLLTYTYFKDHVLCDDDFNVLNNYDEMVGEDPGLHYVGDQDTVYICNPKYEMLIEVLRSELSYDEYLDRNPYKRR